MLRMKYDKLMEMLSKDYNVSAFEDDIVVDLFGAYFIIETNNEDYSVSVFQDKKRNALEVLIEEKINGEWCEVDKKYYVNVKSAYNKIIKSL